MRYAPSLLIHPHSSKQPVLTTQYALGDFAVRQAALALNKSSSDVSTYANRSMNFVNMWDSNVTSDGYTGFAQRRYPNGTFAYSSPDACSPVDPVSHSCARGTDNDVGFYECKLNFIRLVVVFIRVLLASSWEMSFFAPHSISTLIGLMGGNDTFVSRVCVLPEIVLYRYSIRVVYRDHYFTKGYFQAGNEPSFSIPWIYHYAGRPDLSALRVRQVVYNNFNTEISGYFTFSPSNRIIYS